MLQWFMRHESALLWFYFINEAEQQQGVGEKTAMFSLEAESHNKSWSVF